MRGGVFVAEGGSLPRGYGRAYWCPDLFGAVAYPVPLNWIVRGGRWLWLRLSRPASAHWETRELRARLAGRREQYDRCAEQAERAWEALNAQVETQVDREAWRRAVLGARP